MVVRPMLIYLLRWLSWIIRRARPHRAPDYVVIRLHGAYRDCPLPIHPLLRRLRPPRPTLLELAERFQALARDEHVRGVIVELGDLQLASAQVDTLRGLLAETRRAGKRVIAWSHSYTRASYQVATAADEVLLLPGGSVGPLAIASGFPFLADGLARLGVQADVLAISPYKTAADMISRTEMSDEAREMAEWLLDSVFDQHLRAIAEGRDVSIDRARELADATPCTDLRALELGLVDALVTHEELPSRLRQGDALPRVEHWDRAAGSLGSRPSPMGQQVGLISIEGTIAHGESSRPPVPAPVPFVGPGRTGDLTIADAARRAIEDPRIGAVVVHVNSPGGSATASESMRSALAELAGRKPVVMSLGPVAASGGYYVATAARPIVAQPGTLTGSIGVVGGKVVVGGLLEKLGVNVEFLARGRHALIASPTRMFSDEERAIFFNTMRRSYDLFLDRVCEGRTMQRDALEPLAGGRVWTGQQAMEHGLVDESGDLDHAIRRARTLARLPERAPVRLLNPTGGFPLMPPVADDGASLLSLLGLRSPAPDLLGIVAVLAEGRPAYLPPFLLELDG